MKKFYVLLLSMIMILAMAGCGGEANEAEETTAAAGDQSIQITMDIDFPDDSGVADIEDAVVTVEADSSVLNALITYGNENDIEITMDESSADPYVTGIAGVLASDSSGWTYEVNEEMVMESADACILEDGDEISWEFQSWEDM